MNSSEENPFKAPVASPPRPAVSEDSPSKVRAVGKAQRLVNYGIVLYLLLILINVAAEVVAVRAVRYGPSMASVLFPILSLGILLFILVAVGRLAYALHGIGNSVIYCFCMLIPCIGLIPLLFLNARATKYLKQNGVKVGLLGAKLNTLP